jgi:glycogen debranching enzyme
MKSLYQGLAIASLGFFFACASGPDDTTETYTPPSLREVVIGATLNLNANTSDSQETVMDISLEDYYNTIGISLLPGEKEQFIVGDNIAGYYEGYTHSYSKGQGYLMVDQVVYENFASFVDGGLNNRPKLATNQIVQPWGTKIQLTGGMEEEFALHSKNYSLSMRVTSQQQSKLGILPLLQGNVDDWTFLSTEDAFIMSPALGSDGQDPTAHIAFAANQAFEVVMNQEGEFTEVSDILKVRDTEYRGVFVSLEPTQDFIVYMAFGATIEEAVNKAMALRSDEGHYQEKKKVFDWLTKSHLWTSDMEYNRALAWSKYSSYTMVVEEFGKGIWAGLPWFKNNWGRDTFIALPGTLLVTGAFDEAKEVMDNFATFQNLGKAELTVSSEDRETLSALRNALSSRGLWPTREENSYVIQLDRTFIQDPSLGEALLAEVLAEVPEGQGEFRVFEDEEFGRVPNRVSSLDEIIYNTTDGTPWLVREIYEYIQYTGDSEYANSIYPMVKRAIEGVEKYFLDEDGLMTHDAADTWMDARIRGDQPWSARGSRAVEIQALWYTMLEAGVYLANENEDREAAAKWQVLAEKAAESFGRLFWNEEEKILADRIREDDTPDYRVRPNQLMAISIPITDPLLQSEQEAYVVKNAVTDLLYPYGIASLSQEDDYFHPYHENIRFHHKDAAYHNGTVWGWNAGFTVHGLAKFGYQELAWDLTENLTDQILNYGTRGSMSENLSGHTDENGNIILSGTFSQAWSVSEFARSGFQDFLGFRPRLLENALIFVTAFPEKWESLDAILPFGQDESLELVGLKKDNLWSFQMSLKAETKKRIVWNGIDNQGVRKEFIFELLPDTTLDVSWDVARNLFYAENKAVLGRIVQDSYKSVIGELQFLTPNKERVFPMLEGKNVLEDLILEGKYY